MYHVFITHELIGDKKYFAELNFIIIFASVKGRLAQLVQSICLTSRGSAVRIRQRPPQNQGLTEKCESFFLFRDIQFAYKLGNS